MDQPVLVKLGSVAFPPVCPACGRAGHVPLEVRKVFFYQEDEAPETQAVVSYTPLFCRECAAQHGRELWHPGLGDYVKRFFASGGEMLGGLIAFGVGLFFLKEAVFKLSLALLVFSCLPLGIGAWVLIRGWRRTAHQFIPKPTPVSSAFDFSDDASSEHEPAWARFSIRDSACRRAFIELNRAQLWDPGGAEATVARQKRAWSNRKREWMVRLGVAGLIVLAIASWWFGWDDD